ncbi:MAG: hypothetical protein A3C61_01900 [Candidatus Yanofskybacteria bacterium RIFCSPHIGHO2_02_FULL_39_10]|uniref:Uncharacterized protein n=1 Tax=Candidatus Yanofskybacteria bacterium RIFCSPHIGHO2_02_FULL_39_10 TaxID=1802674 RepID=A0A1F8F8D9_9BACT|nr:MAG: hypothetical protein A3C61_01900 [Candidatus Yanofskybacteria bacterium RIFCSPHIGHO2_02_FULL_39_10]
MARANKRDSTVLCFWEMMSLKELERMEDLIRRVKTQKILWAMKTLEAGTGKTQKLKELYKMLPVAERKAWFESEVKKHL